MSQIEMEQDQKGLEQQEQEQEEEEEDQDWAQESVESLKEQLEKARMKIVAMKREEKKSPEIDETLIEKLSEKIEFYKKNTWASELKEQIEKRFQAADGLFTRKEIFEKLTGDDEIEKNRQVYAKANLNGTQKWEGSVTLLDIEAFDALPQSAQNSYMEACKNKFNGVRFK